MNKKSTAVLAIFSTILLAIFVCGFSPKSLKKEIVVSAQTEVTLAYDIPLAAELQRKLLYGGSYEKFCEKRFSGDVKSFLGYLNNDILSDLSVIADSLYVPPTEPSVTFDGEFSFQEGATGQKANLEKTYENVLESLDLGAPVKMSICVVYPDYDMETLKRSTSLLASFSTDYSTSGAGRKHNIKLATSKLTATVDPNCTFSFNSAVGKRTAENGYLEANIIIDGEFVSGVGGGVCQVSTTLYNAWLLSGKAVPCVSSHSLAVSYVEPAFDAMVSEGSDLVLWNDSPFPAYIKGSCDGNKITFSVYGCPADYTIRLRSKTVREVPAQCEEKYGDLDWQEEETLRVTKKPKNGLIADGYREFVKNGKIIKSERLRRCYYAPVNGEIILKRDK